MKKNMKRKNTIDGSTVSSGGNTHIGDKVVNNNYYDEQGRDKVPKTKPYKLTFSFIIKLAVASTIVFGVTISIDNININLSQWIKDDEINTEHVPEPLSPSKKDENGEEDKETTDHPKDKKISDLNNDKDTGAKPPPNKPEVNIHKYIDVQQTVQVTTLGSYQGNFPNLMRDLETKFSQKGIKFSSNLFRPAFQPKFGSSVRRMDVVQLRKIGLTKRLNCICQLIEDVEFEKSKIDGVPLYTTYTARGVKVLIQILNLKTGHIDETVVTGKKGAGMSKETALLSLEEKLIESEEYQTINFEQCK